MLTIEYLRHKLAELQAGLFQVRQKEQQAMQNRLRQEGAIIGLQRLIEEAEQQEAVEVVDEGAEEG